MSGSPKEIVITGGIGSGKTYVCRLFEKLGAPVYYSDSRAKELVNESLDLKTKIESLLGSESYINGTYNTKFVSSRVFNNKQLLQKLNNIIHPAVAENYRCWVAKHHNYPYTVKESALIFELNLEAQFNKTVLITANEELRIDRVLKRDPWRGKSEVKAIINKQLSDAEKESRTNFIISTNKSNLVLPQVLKVHKALLN